MTMTSRPDADLHFWFDPVCPFAWMTSKWVRMVAEQRAYRVQWRFISLRLLNKHIEYDTHFPPEYEAGHTAGLRLLRVAARARELYGEDAVAAFYAACGDYVFEQPPRATPLPALLDSGTALPVVLDAAGLPADLAQALEDTSYDELIRGETDEALARTGKDVGTPILHFQPPHGVAFFGPVISRLPSEQDAVALWDHVVGLASFAGFAELKRSLRELPQLTGLGVVGGDVGQQEDWHAGSRRQKK